MSGVIPTAGKSMSIKSFLLTLAIFCGGYVSNTLLDNALDAALAIG
jgi:hypothetical protein